MSDAALHHREKVKQKSTILTDIGVDAKGLILATIHRAKNTGSLGTLTSIVDGLEAVAKQNPVALPFHQRTAARINGIGRKFEHV